MDPGARLPANVLVKIVDFLVSDTLACGQGRHLHVYALVNRCWAFHIRPTIFRRWLLITQETAESFLHYVKSHTIQPNIRDCVTRLHLVLDISIIDCTPWFHEVMGLLRIGAFQRLESYLIEDCGSQTEDLNRTQKMCADGELQIRQLTRFCSRVPHDRCARMYRDHRMRTLGTFLDLIDIEDGAFLWCWNVKWLQRMDPHQATILATRRGHRRGRFSTRYMTIEGCSVAWQLLLAFVTTEQSEPPSSQSSAYVHRDELPKVLKLFESFMDKCTCHCCYRPRDQGRSKEYHLRQWAGESKSSFE